MQENEFFEAFAICTPPPKRKTGEAATLATSNFPAGATQRCLRPRKCTSSRKEGRSAATQRGRVCDPLSWFDQIPDEHNLNQEVNRDATNAEVVQDKMESGEEGDDGRGKAEIRQGGSTPTEEYVSEEEQDKLEADEQLQYGAMVEQQQHHNPNISAALPLNAPESDFTRDDEYITLITNNGCQEAKQELQLETE